MWNSTVVSTRARCLLLLICVTAIAGRTLAVDESEQKQPSTAITMRKPSGPNCGLYCLYTVMKLFNREVDFGRLYRPEYIGSRRGSSYAELRKAAEDNGLFATSVGKLTSRSLLNCRYPVILHVKSEIGSDRYDHYELFLGTENGKAKLFDPPNPARSVPFAELAPRWDGNGLIVSPYPIDIGAVVAPSRSRFVISAAVAITVVLAGHWVKRLLPKTLFNSRAKLLGVSMIQGVMFVLLALLCGILYHFANDEALLANANATASIQKAHRGDFIQKISEKKVHKLRGGNTVFIDARVARDFEAGHLEGAISVPVDANDVERKRATANTAKDAHVVLYCQSSACKYAEIVAVKLMDDGFSNISIFRGGWAEWVTKNGRPKEATI